MHDPRVRRAFLVVTALELVLLLLVHAPRDSDKPGVAGGIRTAAAQLRGEGPPVDLVQDYVGAQRLVGRGDPYARVTEAYASVGITREANHRSTHPPTAFELVLPVAWLPFRAAAAVWAALMLAAIAVAWWGFGARPEVAAALAPLTLVWPPAAWSLGQLTPLWLLGLALAWRFRDRPATAGVAVALASLTKLVPGVSLLPFLVLGRWRALRGFLAVWAGALMVLLALRPGAIQRYAHVVRATGRQQGLRGENSALGWAAAHRFGLAGFLAAFLLVIAVTTASLNRIQQRERLDRWSWDAWTWLGVALLPIAWIYSLLPLLPAAIRCVGRGGIVARSLAAVTLGMPFLVDPFGLPGAIRLAAATACLGLSLLALACWPALKRRLAWNGVRETE